MRALVVGGGIGGLAAAIALRRAGLEVTVFEQAEELREIGAGLSIWANAVRALQALGLGEAVRPIGTAIERVQLKTWRGRVLGEIPAGAIGRKLGAPSLGVHRADLAATLAARLDDGVIRLGARCTGFDQDASGVTADFADGRRERGDLLIGADGLHSIIRTQLHGLAKPRYAGYTAWRGVADFADPVAFPRGLAYESLGGGQRFGALHLGQGRVYWYATANLPEGSADAPEGRRSELLRRFKGWHAPVEALIAATDEPGILRHDIYDRKPIRRWGEGRVTLVGDAAHPMTPNQGQGACQAIEDAVALGAALGERFQAPGSSPAPASQVGTALRAYEARRFARTAAITNLSRQGGWAGQWENPLTRGLRDGLLRVLLPTYLTRRFEKLLAYDV